MNRNNSFSQGEQSLSKQNQTTLNKVSNVTTSQEFFKTEKLDDNIMRSMITVDPGMLFGEFFFEQELSILFGDNGCGKSILAYQIAYHIANGKNELLAMNLTCGVKKVLFCDFELSPKQRELRYTSKDKSKSFVFGSNFILCEFEMPLIPEGYSFEEFFIQQLEMLIDEHSADTIVIDNITFISNDLQKGNKALELMKLLKNLKDQRGISILLLAHVPKRDESLPITKNDLSGSKNISNFLDSAFAIGVCLHEKGLRYIKQLKFRSTEEKYGADNVLVCKIQKDDCFLGFKFLRFDNETNMLLDKKKAEIYKRRMDAKQLKLEGKSIREIAKLLEVSHNQIAKDLKC